VDTRAERVDVPRLVRASDSEGDSIGLGGTVDPVQSFPNLLDKGAGEYFVIIYPNTNEFRLVTYGKDLRYQKHLKRKLNWFGNLLARLCGVKF